MFTRLIPVLLVAFMLTGCKVRIDVPQGGSVVSASGTYQCAAGQTCDIDVSDDTFDEIFIAVPDGDHQFEGWAQREKGLCGGNFTPCQLFTTLFGGNALLSAILDSDDVFFLEPVFSSARQVSLSGTALVPGGYLVDSDTNDALGQPVSNNNIDDAQFVSGAVAVGGYVNVAGEGAEGPLQENGDTDDYYEMDLLAGDVLELDIAETSADLDLYLVDEDDTVVDVSMGSGTNESVVVPEDGVYFVNVFVEEGASSYVLSLTGSQSSARVGNYGLGDRFVPGQMVVKYRSATGPVGALTNDPDAAPVLERFSVDTAVTSSSRPTLRERRFRSDRDKRKWRTLRHFKTLSVRSDVEYVEPNLIYSASAVPNDPVFPYQWHYANINLPQAWDVTTGSASAVVAVIDTGVLVDHPELSPNLVPGYDFISDPGISGDGDGIDSNPDEPFEDLDETFSHGSHVAGTIAAASNNGRGGAGVAWNAKVMAVRALGLGGDGTLYDLLQAMRYAAGASNDSGKVPATPVRIVNMSLGSTTYSQAIADTVALVRRKGRIMVAAAGNEGVDTPEYPAAYPGVISVGATGQDDSRAPYSNYGTTLDVVAPGGDMSQDSDGDGNPDGVISSGVVYNDGEPSYTELLAEGTSMATPHVAGVIALMKSVNPGLTPDGLDYLIAQGSITRQLGAGNGRNDDFGFGIIDAALAVSAAQSFNNDPPPERPELAVSPASLDASSGSAELLITNRGTGDLTIIRVTSNAPWLAAAPLETDASGLGAYRLIADLSSLSPGDYDATVTVESDQGVATVAVSVTADGSIGFSSNMGNVFALLLDEHTGSIVTSLQMIYDGGSYRYVFDNVKEGRYFLFAGTDMDGDFTLCDSGEACGFRYNINLQGDTGDQNLILDYRTYDESGSSAGAGPAPQLPLEAHSDY